MQAFFDDCAALGATGIARKLSFGEILGLGFVIWFTP